MLKGLSNSLTWYKMHWDNDLKSYHTKNHCRKKQENKDDLAVSFNNQIMYLSILIFGSKLMLLFRKF